VQRWEKILYKVIKYSEEQGSEKRVLGVEKWVKYNLEH